ncbi:MAG: tRNA (adenosine(37)-N6)-threonylcarbamoyltransferase complex ATPase subunit type 1 TsaE [Filomicrobium sp.]
MNSTASYRFHLPGLDEAELGWLAQELAFVLRSGDVIALVGDLGAGKSTLARAVIRTLADDPHHEVPSPTFTLVQTYETGSTPIAHFDLYRLSAAEELNELGFEHLMQTGAALVEWPDRAEDRLPAEHLEISLDDPGGSGETRDVALTGNGAWAARLKRFEVMHGLLADAGFQGGEAKLKIIAADASARGYARVEKAVTGSATSQPSSAFVMDWPKHPDGPPLRDGKPYSQIAKLAEHVTPFIAVARALKEAQLSAPEIYATDEDAGFILLEDFGEQGYAQALTAGVPQDALWRNAVDALVHLRSLPADQPLGGTDEVDAAYTLPELDKTILEIETDLVPDWLWPAVHGAPMTEDEHTAYRQIWSPIFDEILSEPTGWLLRDYHSPNLLHLPQREGFQAAGMIDFQDALQGPLAYDLVSLLQDARLDVPEELETELLAHYIATVRQREPVFGDEAESRFRSIYAMLGAERNTKILGIFVRLAKRDGKTRYLAHMPRIWGYLERNLRHPDLKPLAQWYDKAFPRDLRGRTLSL